MGAFRDDFGERDVKLGDKKANSSRQRRKRLKRLHSLALAILPVITSPPLWTLPTVLENVDQETEKLETIANMTITEVHDDSNIQTVSVSALKGNAAMVCSLIGLLSETVQLLLTEVESFLPVILFPLCEKTSSQNHSQVQRTAALALRQVATACGLSSTRDLIRQNFDYLFGAMLSQTRRPGSQATVMDNSFPTTIPSIVQIVLRSATDADTTTECIRCERSLSDETHVSYVIELVNSLVVSFDNNLVILNSKPVLLASTAMDLVEVFDSALMFIASTFGLNLDKESDPFADVPIPVACADWMKALEPFQKRSKLESNGFEVRERFEPSKTEPDDPVTASDSAEPSKSQLSIEITGGELDFVRLALDRCCFFLSSPSLIVEMASSIGMQRAFALLGYVAMYSKVSVVTARTW